MSSRIWSSFAALHEVNNPSSEDLRRHSSPEEDASTNKNCQLDTEVTIPITLEEAGAGLTRTLQINDEVFDLKISSGVTNGQKLLVRGKGNLEPVTGRRGDH